MWGSNARNAHPIFFHHILKGIHNGAKLYVVDPRRSETAEWADLWLGLDIGTDIPLASAIGRVIIEKGLANQAFIDHSTENFEAYRRSVDEWTLEKAEAVTGVPAVASEELAVAYASAGSAQLCWTLGITEHHNATDNVLALINLSLLTGHVGRYGSGLVPVRGQNNVQGGGDMGALPNKLPGFQDVADDSLRGKFEAEWGYPVPAENGWHLTQMFEAMEHGDLKALYVIGENPAQSEADVGRARSLLESLDFMVVQDLFMTATAELADVVFPAAADWCESEGTVTSSERRVQRVRRALDPPGSAKTDIEIISLLAGALGHGWGTPTAEEVWDECRRVSPMHAGMSYRRLEELGGIQWPCYDEDHPGELFLHSRLWEEPVGGPLAPFTPVEHSPPVDLLDADFPLRMTTGRRLDGYNTGVQSGGFDSPIRIGASIDLSPEDAADLGVSDGETVRVASRRGGIEAPVRVDDGLRPGLVFMAIHNPDDADVNQLTIEEWDAKSGTAEFKATAVSISRLG